MRPIRPEMNDLPGGMHPCIRPTGSYNAGRLPRYALNCRFKLCLHSGFADLYLKTTVRCAVVRYKTAKLFAFTCRFASAYCVFLRACPFVRCQPILQHADGRGAHAAPEFEDYSTNWTIMSAAPSPRRVPSRRVRV